MVTSVVAEERPKEKKTFTTPLKEKAKRERAIAKLEQEITLLEQEAAELEAEAVKEENISDYLKLSEITENLEAKQEKLINAYDEWEKLKIEYEKWLGL